MEGVHLVCDIVVYFIFFGFGGVYWFIGKGGGVLVLWFDLGVGLGVVVWVGGHIHTNYQTHTNSDKQNQTKPSSQSVSQINQITSRPSWLRASRESCPCVSPSRKRELFWPSFLLLFLCVCVCHVIVDFDFVCV